MNYVANRPARSLDASLEVLPGRWDVRNVWVALGGFEAEPPIENNPNWHLTASRRLLLSIGLKQFLVKRSS